MRCLFSFILAMALSKLSYGLPLSVMIDPGHGGMDSGAVRGTLKESELTLKVSRLLQTTLNADKSFHAELTRSADQFISLETRTKMAQNSHAQLLISIHLNANDDPHAYGTEVYFQNLLPANEESLYLAASENHERPKSPVDDSEPTKASDITAIIKDWNVTIA